MSEQAQLFDLTLTEEQRISREMMKKFAETQLRAISRDADEAAEAPEGFYKKTMELGLSLMPIPEEVGGAGMPRSPISNMLNAEDLGKGDMSLALGALTPLAFINTIIDNGSKEQQEAFLSPFISEEFVPATIALMEPRATFDPSELQTTVKKEGDFFVLNGVKTTVLLGDTAQQILVVAEEDGVAGAYVVPAGAEGMRIENEKYMGLHSINTSKITLENVKVPALNKLGSEASPFDLNRMIALSRIGLGALAVGCAEAMLEYVTEYVNERVAFGEPISHRQSVAFMVANIAIELEAMRMMVYRAASRAEQGLDFYRDAYLAQVICAEKGMEIGNNGVQLLGGHGFIREHMVELWYRNLRSVGVLEGVATV